MRFPDARILIFARAPQVGVVKTRLIPRLGAEAACRFHQACVIDTVRRFAVAGIAPVTLCCYPDVDHPLFAGLSRLFGISLLPQQGADLGQRMYKAAAQAVREGQTVMLTGTDIPCLQPEHANAAFEALAGETDVVMSAAEDGGYVMLAFRQLLPELFQDMPWGTDRVAAMTRQRIASDGLRLHETEVLWDVDRPQDLQRVPQLENWINETLASV